MRQQPLVVFAILIGTATSGCRSGSVPPISSPVPAIPSVLAPDPSTLRSLQFTPGTYRYQLTQTAEIEGDGITDTVPSTIVTQAVVNAIVTSQLDSSFTVIVSFDSITMSAQGSIPIRGIAQVTSLDSVAQGTFSRVGNTVVGHLPDSLCSYSQFTSIARELLLPELTIDITSSRKRTFTDTSIHYGCRAGTRIDITTIRELRDPGRNLNEVEIQQHAEIRGTGVLRRDSITISGSIATRGKASFAAANRLPHLIQTQSDGTITVHLGSIRTRFRQRSTQEIRLTTAEPNQ